MALVIAAAILLGFLCVAAAVVWTSPRRGSAAPDMREAVDLVIDLAADKLGDSVAAGTRELDVRNHAFTEQVAGVRSELERLDRVVGELRNATAEQHGSLLANLRQVTATNTTLATHTAPVSMAGEAHGAAESLPVPAMTRTSLARAWANSRENVS